MEETKLAKIIKDYGKFRIEAETLEDLESYETNLINVLNEAINYTHCCTELKDKEVRTFEDFLRLFCEETGKQKWIYNDSVWSLDYLFYKYKELYKPL